jgi:hypothetical protein
MRKRQPLFFILFSCVAFSVFFYELIYLWGMWQCMGRLYFNLRHFTWTVPFIIVVYSYGLAQCISSKPLRIRIIGAVFLGMVLIVGYRGVSRVLSGGMNPFYREALSFIKDNTKGEGDFIAFPIYWMLPAVNLNGHGLLDPARDHYGQIKPTELQSRMVSFRRFWMLFPREDYFGVPHLNPEFLDKYFDFVRQNLEMVSVRRFNKLDVYLFEKKAR